jgi:hypothetical protein
VIHHWTLTVLTGSGFRDVLKLGYVTVLLSLLSLLLLLSFLLFSSLPCR